MRISDWSSDVCSSDLISMFGSMQGGANAYAKVGMETGVIAANPHQLIVMLFEGAQAALNNALQHMQTGNIAEKGKAISKAIMLIESGLRASLDKSVGGEIAVQLDELYAYMRKTKLGSAQCRERGCQSG